MITFRPAATRKEITDILSNPDIFFKINGCPWAPGAEVYVAEYNYLVQLDGVTVGLLQVLPFAPNCPRVEYCILPAFRKPKMMMTIIKDSLKLFESVTRFPKMFITVPSVVTNVPKLLKKIGFVHEATIKDIIYYHAEMVDCLFFTYTFNRD